MNPIKMMLFLLIHKKQIMGVQIDLWIKKKKNQLVDIAKKLKKRKIKQWGIICSNLTMR